jgi:hypothetical protein
MQYLVFFRHRAVFDLDVATAAAFSFLASFKEVFNAFFVPSGVGGVNDLRIEGGVCVAGEG